MLDLSTSGSTSTLDDVRSDYNSEKADVNILLNQNFACQIEMMHISFVNLQVTEMTLVSLT